MGTDLWQCALMATLYCPTGKSDHQHPIPLHQIILKLSKPVPALLLFIMLNTWLGSNKYQFEESPILLNWDLKWQGSDSPISQNRRRMLHSFGHQVWSMSKYVPGFEVSEWICFTSIYLACHHAWVRIHEPTISVFYRFGHHARWWSKGGIRMMLAAGTDVPEGKINKPF